VPGPAAQPLSPDQVERYVLSALLQADRRLAGPGGDPGEEDPDLLRADQVISRRGQLSTRLAETGKLTAITSSDLTPGLITGAAPAAL
jgi:hypothetical protein